MTQNEQSTTARTGGVDANLALHGKLSYIQIPAIDVDVSGAFYRDVFGWDVHGTAEHRSFTDASGELIGAFMPHLSVSKDGVLPYIYVEGIDAVVAKIAASGGEIVRSPYPEGGLWVATFRDPAGNVLGVWQQGPR